MVTEVKEIVKEISHTLSSSSDPDAEERRKRVFKVKSTLSMFMTAQKYVAKDVDVNLAETNLIC